MSVNGLIHNGSEVEELVVKLFKQYLDTEDVGTGEDTRFQIVPVDRDDEGKYGRVSYFSLADKSSGGVDHFVLKQNRGMSPDDQVRVTQIEADILQNLRSEELPVVEYCAHSGFSMLMKRLDGTTLAQSVRERSPDGGTLPYGDYIKLIDSMLSINRALSSFMDHNSDTRKRLETRRLELLANQLGFRPNDLEENFYAYRAIATGQIADHEGFKAVYEPINKALNQVKKGWISFDHPENRIVVPYGDDINNVRYDFNHVSWEFIGIDLALLLGAISDYSEPEKYVNMTDLVILELHKEDAGRYTLGGRKEIEFTQAKIDQLRHESSEDQFVPISEFYDRGNVLEYVVAMYAAFTHRAVLSTFRSADEYVASWPLRGENPRQTVIPIGDEVTRSSMDGHAQSILALIGLANRFQYTLSDTQKDKLDKAGYGLVTEPNPLLDHVFHALSKRFVQ